MKRALITAPASYPVSTAEVKAQTTIDFADDDTLLRALIAAATDMAENYTGRSLIAQTWDYYLDDFPSCIDIPVGPVSAVTSVKYYDGSNVEQTLNSSLYYTDLRDWPVHLIPVTTWPAVYDKPNAVTVRLVQGHANAAAIPAAIKHAMLMMIAHLYENREAVAEKTMTEVPLGASFLLDQWAIR